MEVELYKKVDIARTQLETAIRLFFLGEDYFSVVTLAGASEEICGRILQLLGKEPELYARARSIKILSDALFNEKVNEDDYRKNANVVRNSIKHFDSLAAQTIAIDARGSALDMLSRAIDNYKALSLPRSAIIERFEIYCENREEEV